MSSKRNGSGSDGLPHILTTEQAAEYLGLSPSTLNQWRATRYGPAPMRWGRGPRALVRYLRADLDEFLRTSRINSGA